MNKVAPGVLASLVIGVSIGFFLGIASTKAGRSFILDIVEDERKAEVSQPNKVVRESFTLQYPSNWKIAIDDEDYDPDHMFSIESPGSAFVMFVIGPGETEPENNLQAQIQQFTKLMTSPSIERFKNYGRLSGKGAILKGKILGIRITTKVFAFHQDDLTIITVQQYPDEDMKHVQEGFALIESSFLLFKKEKKDTQDKPGKSTGN